MRRGINNRRLSMVHVPGFFFRLFYVSWFRSSALCLSLIRNRCDLLTGICVLFSGRTSVDLQTVSGFSNEAKELSLLGRLPQRDSSF